MASHNVEIDRLIQALARLPGLGPRSARRAVLHLIRKRDRLLEPLSEALKEVGERIRDCEVWQSARAYYSIRPIRVRRLRP